MPGPAPLSGRVLAVPLVPRSRRPDYVRSPRGLGREASLPSCMMLNDSPLKIAVVKSADAGNSALGAEKSLAPRVPLVTSETLSCRTVRRGSSATKAMAYCTQVVTGPLLVATTSRPRHGARTGSPEMKYAAGSFEALPTGEDRCRAPSGGHTRTGCASRRPGDRRRRPTASATRSVTRKYEAAAAIRPSSPDRQHAISVTFSAGSTGSASASSGSRNGDQRVRAGPDNQR